MHTGYLSTNLQPRGQAFNQLSCCLDLPSLCGSSSKACPLRPEKSPNHGFANTFEFSVKFRAFWDTHRLKRKMYTRHLKKKNLTLLAPRC